MPKSKKKRVDITSPQQQLIAHVLDLDDDGLKAIASEIDELAVAVSKGDLTLLEELLSSHILTLNYLQAHYQIKSLKALDPRVITALPDYFEKLSNISIKLQIEMRKAIALLADLKNPKKPSQFIKSYVDKQVNSLQVTNDAEEVDRETKTEAARVDPGVATVVEIDRSKNGCREGQVTSE